MPLTAATTATRSATSAVASLTRLSPSTITTSRRGTPSRFEIAVAAIGSVGETTAPSTKAAAQSSPIAAWATTATADHRHQHEPDARAGRSDARSREGRGAR